MMRRLTIGMILCWMGTVAGAQEVPQSDSDCAVLLSEAENNFAAGKYYTVPTLLQGCIDQGGYSREEQVRVHMLLTQSYLLSDEPLKAENSYIQLLTADPEYVANEAVDPIDVVYLSKKFTTTPVFTPHLKIGPNLSTQEVLHKMDPSESKTDRNPQVGISVGGGIEWNINDNLGIGGEALFSYTAFRTRYTAIYGSDELAVTERQFWIDFPFYVRYGSHVGKVRPYGYAGYAVNLLIGDRLNLVSTDELGNEAGQNEVSGNANNLTYKRQMLNGSLVFGGGIKYKWGKNFLLLDLRYNAGLTNVVNEKTSPYDEGNFDLSNLLPRYGYVSPLFKVNSYSFSVGFVRPLYDPRKVQKANTKRVSRKLSRE
jgi:hypothetical protein